jgi:hypothetical protein
MTRSTRSALRAFVAPLLAVLSLASTVVSPLLDATDSHHGTVFESKHDATCWSHDESICTQVTGNLAVAAPIPFHRFEFNWQSFDAFLTRDEAAPRSAVFLPLGSRAPPLS